MEGHQIEGCQPPTSFRPPERQKQDGTVQLVSQPTAAVSRTGPGLCWVAGLRGGAEYWSRCQDWRRPLSQTAQDGGTGNRLRCSEKLGSSLDCRLKCATNPGPRQVIVGWRRDSRAATWPTATRLEDRIGQAVMGRVRSRVSCCWMADGCTKPTRETDQSMHSAVRADRLAAQVGSTSGVLVMLEPRTLRVRTLCTMAGRSLIVR